MLAVASVSGIDAAQIGLVLTYTSMYLSHILRTLWLRLLLEQRVSPSFAAWSLVK